jgi:hypothetical protein
MVEGKGDDLGMFGEEGVDGAAEVADAFAVDDADLEEALVLTGGEVFEEEVLDLARVEGVEVEHAVNGQLDRAGAGFVHGGSIGWGRAGDKGRIGGKVEGGRMADEAETRDCFVFNLRGPSRDAIA